MFHPPAPGDACVLPVGRASQHTYLNITAISGLKSLTISLERHSEESPSESCVERPPEDVQSDVGEAGERGTVNSQHHRVGAQDSTGQDVQLQKKRQSSPTQQNQP